MKKVTEPCIPLQGTNQCIPESFMKAPRKSIDDPRFVGGKRWSYLRGDDGYIDADIIVEESIEKYVRFNLHSLIVGIIITIIMTVFNVMYVFTGITTIGLNLWLPLFIGSIIYTLNALIGLSFIRTISSVIQYIGEMILAILVIIVSLLFLDTLYVDFNYPMFIGILFATPVAIAGISFAVTVIRGSPEITFE